MSAALIRPVRAEDAAAIAAIYAPYVAETVITFEYDAPDAAEIARRIAAFTPTHPWLVAERGGQIVGYGYGSPYRSRAAYRWVAESGIYMDRAARGGGVGTLLYEALCDALAEHGYVAVMGVMTLPNAASEALHRKCGFRDVGTQPGIGFKFGGWHDVGFWQRDLAPRASDPTPPPATSADLEHPTRFSCESRSPGLQPMPLVALGSCVRRSTLAPEGRIRR